MGSRRSGVFGQAVPVEPTQAIAVGLLAREALKFDEFSYFVEFFAEGQEDPSSASPIVSDTPEIVRLYALVSPQRNLKVRHTLGLPKSLDPSGDEPVLMPPARLLIIEETTEGAYLLRYSIEAEFAGDTWHQSVTEAKDQAAFEYEPAPEWAPAPAARAAIDDLVRELLRANGGGGQR